MKPQPIAPAAPPRRPPPTGDVQADNPPPPDRPGVRHDIERTPAAPEAPPPRNPNSREPTEEEKPKLDRLHEAQDRRLDAIFRGDDPEPVPPPVKPPVAEPKPPVAEPVRQETPPEEPQKEEGDDINFDKPPPGAVVSDKERESLAQIRARENGQALKDLETKHNETILEMNRIKEELETAKKAGTAAPARREDFLTHPDVDPVRQEVIKDIMGVAEVQSLSEAGQLLSNRFGVYMTGYMAKNAAADESEARALDAELRTTLKEDFRDMYKEVHGQGYDQAEMDRGAQEYSREVLQLLVRNAGRTRQIESKISDLVHKAREGTLAQNVDVYTFHETDLGKAIDAIPSIPDDVIEENPFTVEATIAKLVKEDAWKTRYQATRKQVLELLLGPRVLSQKEIDDMQTGGIDVRKFYKDRQKSWLDRRKKLAVSITQALLLRGIWEQTAKDAEASRASNKELEIFSRSRPKEGEPPPPPAAKKRIGTEFVSSIESHLQDVERY